MLMFLQSATVPGNHGYWRAAGAGTGRYGAVPAAQSGDDHGGEGEMRRVREYVVIADERESEKGSAPGRQDDAGEAG